MAALSSFAVLAQARSPSNPSGKARMLRRREHRTPDRRFEVLPRFQRGRPFSSRPGSSGRRPYTRWGKKGNRSGNPAVMLGILDQFGEPHGEFDPLAQLLGAGAASGG